MSLHLKKHQVGSLVPYSRSDHRENSWKYSNSQRKPFVSMASFGYYCYRISGFRPVTEDDIMYSPIDRLRPQRCSYSFETGFVVISTCSNPANFTIFSNSSTEEAPDTQHECMASSSCISFVSSFMITISQIDILPPGFNARNISL